MQFSILGPLAAHEAGVSIVPTAAKPRQLLSLLALNANHIVTVQDLMEELWGTSPRSAPTTLQTYILQLRRKLRAALKDGARDVNGILVTRYGGYLLEVDPACVDALEFHRLITAGYAAFEAGSMARASILLSSALELWHGPVLVDVTHGTQISIEVTRLTECRMGALERRIDADLQLGRHHELIGELTGLAGRCPMHENLHGQLMLALYRAGRTADALDTYQRLRDSLVEDLGLEPSSPVRRLQRAILRSDPALDLREEPIRPYGGALVG